MPRIRAASSAFSLIELMVALAVLAILVSLAAPSFANLLRSQRLQAAGSEWLSLTAYARSEAIRRSHAIRIVASDAGFRMLDASSAEVLREWRQADVSTQLSGADELRFEPPLGSLAVAEACVRLDHSSVAGYRRLLYLGRAGTQQIYVPGSGAAVPAKVSSLCGV